MYFLLKYVYPFWDEKNNAHTTQYVLLGSKQVAFFVLDRCGELFSIMSMFL